MTSLALGKDGFLYPSSRQAPTGTLVPSSLQRLSPGLGPWKRAFTRHKSIRCNLEFVGWLSAPSFRPRLFCVCESSRIQAAFSQQQPPCNPLPLPVRVPLFHNHPIWKGCLPLNGINCCFFTALLTRNCPERGVKDFPSAAFPRHCSFFPFSFFSF